jgi:protein-L-isoaspartate(D-aspartate) O-methyltransferase
MEIPLGAGEVMLAPKLEARMLQEAAVGGADRVLEVGTGSGYMTALLASLARQVYSVDIVPEFVDRARRKLAEHGIANVTLETGDAARGWAQHAPYDVIVLTGSVPHLPEAFERSLALGGRLIAIVGDEPVMTARRVKRVSESAFSREGLFETCVKALRNALQPERFVF